MKRETLVKMIVVYLEKLSAEKLKMVYDFARRLARRG